MRMTNIEIARDRYYGITATFSSDMTAWTWRAQIRETQAQSSTKIADFIISAGSYSAQQKDDSDSTYLGTPVTLTLSESVTDGVTQDVGYWDLVGMDANGRAYTFIFGQVVFVDYPTERI
jgi:hypothetical protein